MPANCLCTSPGRSTLPHRRSRNTRQQALEDQLRLGRRPQPGSGAYQIPDFDINYGLGDRIQLKYELPIAIKETRQLPATPEDPVQPGSVLVGLGNCLMGVKWRFYQHHPGDNWFGPTKPTKPEAASNAEPVVDFSVSTYPQLTLENPTRSVPRGVVPSGPDFLLPLEVNG